MSFLYITVSITLFCSLFLGESCESVPEPHFSTGLFICENILSFPNLLMAIIILIHKLKELRLSPWTPKSNFTAETNMCTGTIKQPLLGLGVGVDEAHKPAVDVREVMPIIINLPLLVYGHYTNPLGYQQQVIVQFKMSRYVDEVTYICIHENEHIALQF